MNVRQQPPTPWFPSRFSVEICSWDGDTAARSAERAGGKAPGLRFPAILLRLFHGSVLSENDAVLLKDDMRHMAGELVAEETGREIDRVRFDTNDAEGIQEFSSRLAVAGDKRVIRSSVIENATGVAVDVREETIDVFLFKTLERDALYEDPANLFVFALDMGLLLRAVGIAIEESRAILER